MKRYVYVLFIMVIAAGSSVLASGIENASAKIVSELQKSNTRTTAHDIAIGEFVTWGYPRAAFGAYFVEALGDAMKDNKSFKVIDQQKVTGVLKNRSFSFNDGYENTVLETISKDIFKTAQETPTAYCFGQVKEIGDEIKITAKLIDAITGATISTATVIFSSDETTDRLLDKPSRTRKPAVTGTPSPTAQVSQEPATTTASVAKSENSGNPNNIILIGNRWKLTCKSVYANAGKYWMLLYSIKDNKFDPNADEERVVRLRFTKITSEKGTVYLSQYGITPEVTLNRDLAVNGEYEVNRYNVPSNTKKFIYIEGELSVKIDGRQMTKNFSSPVDIPVE
jgi:hypothetical protein